METFSALLALCAGNSPVTPVNSPYKGQWRGVLIFSLICAWINGWVNTREAGDLRRHRAHYDLIVNLYYRGLQALGVPTEQRVRSVLLDHQDLTLTHQDLQAPEESVDLPGRKVLMGKKVLQGLPVPLRSPTSVSDRQGGCFPTVGELLKWVLVWLYIRGWCV